MPRTPDTPDSGQIYIYIYVKAEKIVSEVIRGDTHICLNMLCVVVMGSDISTRSRTHSSIKSEKKAGAREFSHLSQNFRKKERQRKKGSGYLISCMIDYNV